MGIESDQLVYDYLSRVGDAAQQRHLPSGERMRLVSTLRNEIDRQRGKFGTDSPAAVRRILGRLGEPEALVRAAAEAGAGAGTAAPQAPGVAVPEQRTGLVKGLLGQRGPGQGPGQEPGSGPGKAAERGPAVAEGGAAAPTVPKQPPPPPATPAPPPTPPPTPAPTPAPTSSPSPSPTPPAPPAPPAADAEPPRPAETDAPRRPPVPPRRQPDWWRIEPGPMDRGGAVAQVPGFVGGVEIPEILKPPPKTPKEPEGAKEAPAPDGAAQGKAGTEDTDPGTEADAASPDGKHSRKRRPLLARRRARKQAGADARAETRTGGLSNPFLLLAAGLLVAGAVLGSPLPLAAGWLFAYASRTLSRAEAKWVVFGLPGVSAAGGLVWLWGRMDRRWGEAIPEDGMADALSGVWPVVLRTAAVSSALYLVWRARRKNAAG